MSKEIIIKADKEILEEKERDILDYVKKARKKIEEHRCDIIYKETLINELEEKIKKIELGDYKDVSEHTRGLDFSNMAYSNNLQVSIK